MIHLITHKHTQWDAYVYTNIQNHKQLHTFTHNIQTMLHMHTQWHIYKRKLYVKKTKAGRCYAKTVKELDVNQNISKNAIIVIL